MSSRRLLASLALMGMLTSSAVLASTKTGKLADGSYGFSDAQKDQIQQVVRDYLVKNPDVIIQSLQIYQQKQMEQARETIEKTKEISPNFADALFHQSSDPVAGGVPGKVTLVEFFDYQCPHCIDMTGVIDDLLSKNKDLRIVYKEFPIRGAVSETAAKAALAANLQGKYREFHNALMSVKKLPLTEDIIFSTAQSVGLNVDKLKSDMKSSAIDQQVKDTYKLAQNLKLLGTPAFFIAKSNVTKNAGANSIVFVPGQVDEAQLQDIIGKM